jgi:hypothetical protein
MPGDDEDLDYEEDLDAETETQESGGTDSTQKPGESRDAGDADTTGHPDDQAADQEDSSTPQALSRGERRFQRLANEAREAREEAARTRRDFDELSRRVSQQPQQQYDPRQEQEYLASLSTDQRVDYMLQRANQTHQQQLAQMQIAMADTNDKNEYTARCSTDKRAARYKDEVERTLQQLRQQGMNPRRETIFYYLVGQKVANGKPSAAQAQGATERRRRQETQGGSPRSDAGQPRSRAGRTLEERLDGVTF